MADLNDIINKYAPADPVAGAAANNNPQMTYTGRKQAEQAFNSAFTYGSFSGADIKVVLSYPINARTAALEVIRLKDRKIQLMDQITAWNSEWQKVSTGGRWNGNLAIIAQKVMDLSDAVMVLEERITYLEAWSKKANEMAATKTLAELQTIAWSIFREKSPVRTLGAVYPRSIVRGPRTIAGTMIFTLFDKSALYDILSLSLNPYSTGTFSDRDYYHNTTALIDQLPPLDLTIIASNEYGQTSYMNLWGVEFMNDGGTFSIEDLFTETVVQYTARDIDLLRPTVSRNTDVMQNIVTGKPMPKTAGALAQQKFSNSLNDLYSLEVIGTEKRRNPYI